MLMMLDLMALGDDEMVIFARDVQDFAMFFFKIEDDKKLEKL